MSGAAAQADSQSEQTAVIDAVDAALEASNSGIEFEKTGSIASFDPDDPWADMQFEDDTDTPPDNPLDSISFRR